MKYYVNYMGRSIINEAQFNEIVNARANAMKQDSEKMNHIIKELYDFYELYSDMLQKPDEVTKTIMDAVRHSAEWEIRQTWKEEEKTTDANFVWVHWQNSEVFSDEEANEKISAKVKQLYADKERFMEYLDENYEASEIFCMVHPENAEKMDNITNLKREYYTDCEIEAEEQFTQCHQKITLGAEKVEA